MDNIDIFLLACFAVVFLLVLFVKIRIIYQDKQRAKQQNKQKQISEDLFKKNFESHEGRRIIINTLIEKIKYKGIPSLYFGQSNFDDKNPKSILHFHIETQIKPYIILTCDLNKKGVLGIVYPENQIDINSNIPHKIREVVREYSLSLRNDGTQQSSIYGAFNLYKFGKILFNFPQKKSSIIGSFFGLS